ncbi:MAG: hypothetical protein IT306_27375 [Chloroflexi bacterium]|nr:hypothetical protein [Chloroflexota bacterium]
MGRIGWALILGNAAWSVHLVASYYLAWADCLYDDPRLLMLRHLATAVALTVALLAWWLAQRAAAASGPDPEGVADGDGPSRTLAGEQGFLGRVTALLSIVFVLAVVLTGAANLFLFPCV